MLKRFFLALVLVAAMTGLASAKMPTLGSGEKLQFDPAGIPPEYRESYDLMMVKCNNAKCHTIARAVTAVNTGKAPMTKIVFDKAAAKAYGVKMMRMPDSEIDKNQASAIVKLLFYMMDK